MTGREALPAALAPPGFEGPALWTAIFGNTHPVSVEIGSGRGEFLIASAAQNPHENFLGIERSARRVREVAVRLAAQGLANARILGADATCVIRLIPGTCVAAYYILFPDPWWKRRHQRRRLMTAPFVAELRRTLVPDGTIHLVTDVGDYFGLAQRQLNADPALEPVEYPDTPRASTSFARKAAARGGRLYASVHRRRAVPTEFPPLGHWLLAAR